MIEKILHLHMDHVPEHQLIEFHPGSFTWVSSPKGILVFLEDLPTQTAMFWFYDILNFARENHCTHVRFSDRGKRIDKLKQY